MNDKIKLLFTSVFFILVLSIVNAQQGLPGSWAGYARINNSIAGPNINVSAVINNGSTWVANTTIGGPEYASDAPAGYYSIAVLGDSGDSVNFRVCGVSVSIPSQSWSVGPHYNGTSPNFNLSVSTGADGASCFYSCGCNGGYCCSGATRIEGVGTGTCQNSACSAPSPAPSGGGGGGGAAPATTTTTVATTTTVPTTTTTTLPPPVTESEVIEEITPEKPAVIEIEKSDEVKIEKIEIEVTNAVSNVEVTITRTFDQPANVAISAATETGEKVYTYLEIEKTNIEDKDIKNVKISFKVEKSWLTANNIDASTVVLKRYENGAWTELPTSQVSEDSTYIYYKATSPGLSVFAIAAKELPPTTTTTLPPITIPEKLKPIVPQILTLVIIVIFIAFFYFTYKKK